MGLLSQQYGKVIELTAGSTLCTPTIRANSDNASGCVRFGNICVGSENLYNTIQSCTNLHFRAAGNCPIIVGDSGSTHTKVCNTLCTPVVCATSCSIAQKFHSYCRLWNVCDISLNNFFAGAGDDGYALGQGTGVFDLWVCDSGTNVLRSVLRASNDGSAICIGKGCNGNDNANIPVIICKNLSVSKATDNQGIAIGCSYVNTGSWNSQLDIYGGSHSVIRINHGAGTDGADNSKSNCLFAHTSQPFTMCSSGNIRLKPGAGTVCVCGHVCMPVNQYTQYGPNSTWGAYLRVGGNGHTVGVCCSCLYASVVTTDGNLHLDAGVGKGLYLNFYDGSYIYFGSGSNSNVGCVTSACLYHSAVICGGQLKSAGQVCGTIGCFTASESLKIKGVRGQFGGDYMHFYRMVGIGHPNGWGCGSSNTPDYGLSTYGGICVGYGVGTGSMQRFRGRKMFIGDSGNWDVGSLNGNNTTITNVHFQGHNDFWVGAGNSSWWTTATTNHHDLLINTMLSDATYIRGITFTASNAGASTYRMGRWRSGCGSTTSALLVDGKLGIGLAGSNQLPPEHLMVCGSGRFVQSNGTPALYFGTSHGSVDIILQRTASQDFKIATYSGGNNTALRILGTCVYACTCLQSACLHSTGNICGSEICASEWFRSTTGKGMYNSGTGLHWYSTATNQMRLQSGSDNNVGIIGYTCGAGRGCIHWNCYNQIHLFDMNGNARLLINAATDIRLCNTTCVYGTLFGSGVICAASCARSPILYASTCVCSGTVCATGDFKGNNALCLSGFQVMRLPYCGNSTRGPWNPIASAIRGGGKRCHYDEEFRDGTNNVNVYNNTAGGAVTHTRVLMCDEGTGCVAPNASGYAIRICNDGGSSSPGRGGFYQTISSRCGATVAQVFQACVPTGYNLQIAENSQGTNKCSYFLTSCAGTNRWEWYVRVSHMGNTGSFSTGGHIYLSGSPNAVKWYLGSASSFDVTDFGITCQDVLRAHCCMCSGVVCGSNCVQGGVVCGTTCFVGSKAYINGGSNNSGKADFSVGAGSTPQWSFNGCQFQVGGTDMNWSLRAQPGQIGTWNSSWCLFAGCNSGSCSHNLALQTATSSNSPTTYVCLCGGDSTLYLGTGNIRNAALHNCFIIGGNYTNNAYNSTTGARLLFGGGNDPGNYFIGTNLENYGGNYNKLDIRWHTGIRIGAQQQYGGVRFYESEDLGNVLLSIGQGNAHVKACNGAIIYGCTCMQSPILCGTSCVRGTEFCAQSGWFRNSAAAKGLYNSATNSHFYSAGDNYWHINNNSTATSGGLIFYKCYNSSHGGSADRRGYVYWDGTNNFGLLNCGGNWAFRAVGTSCTVLNYGTCFLDWIRVAGTICTPTLCASNKSCGCQFKTVDQISQGVACCANCTCSGYAIGKHAVIPGTGWSKSGASTGRIEIGLPTLDGEGGTGHHGMIHAVVDVYEYCNSHATTYIIGGHNWNCAWYNCGANRAAGCNPKGIKLAYHSCGGTSNGRYVILIGECNSSWSYGAVFVRRVSNGLYYCSNMDLGTDMYIKQVTCADSHYNCTTGEQTAIGTLRIGNICGTSEIKGSRICSSVTGSCSIVSAGGICVASDWYRITGNNGLYFSSHTAGIHGGGTGVVCAYNNGRFCSNATTNWGLRSAGCILAVSCVQANVNVCAGCDVRATGNVCACCNLISSCATYVGEWVRFTSATRGLYWCGNCSLHLYPACSNTPYLHLRSNHSCTALAITTSGNTTARGYLYGDSSNNIGILDSDGSWSYRHLRDNCTEFRINNGIKATIFSSCFCSNNIICAATCLRAPTVCATGCVTAPNVYSNGASVTSMAQGTCFWREFMVCGDADTFYPVCYFRGNTYGYKRYSINRHYSSTAPSTWYSSTHKGGLNYTWEQTSDTQWGGNDRTFRVNSVCETYSTQLGGHAHTVSGGLVLLRGGGALYCFASDAMCVSCVCVYDGTGGTDSKGMAHSSCTYFCPGNCACICALTCANAITCRNNTICNPSSYPLRPAGYGNSSVTDGCLRNLSANGVICTSSNVCGSCICGFNCVRAPYILATNCVHACCGVTFSHSNWSGEKTKIQAHSTHLYFQNYNAGCFFFRNCHGSNILHLNCAGCLYVNNCIQAASNICSSQGITGSGYVRTPGYLQVSSLVYPWSASQNCVRYATGNAAGNGWLCPLLLCRCGGVVINGGSNNTSTDAALFICQTNNNDWGLRVCKNTGSATEYGIKVDMGASATYGYDAVFGGTRKFTVSYNQVCHNQNVCAGSCVVAPRVCGSTCVRGGVVCATSGFYGDGSNLTGVGGGTETSCTHSSYSGTTGITLDITHKTHVLPLASGAVITGFTYSNRSSSGTVDTITLVVKYSGTASITWTNVVWSGGVTPTLTGTSGKADVFVLTSYNGSYWVGTIAATNLDSTNL